MSTTVEGNTRSLKWVQPWKHPIGIYSTPSGITMLRSCSQFENAKLFNLRKVVGNMIFCSDLQPLKAHHPSYSSPSGKVICFKRVQP